MREKEKEKGEFKIENDEVAFKSESDCLNSENSKDEPFVINSHLY